MNISERYMSRALQLAQLGWEYASPNPLVGAVVVARGRIIGEGYHKKCGQAHAEVNAIASIRNEDRHLLTQSTIYVTLEPCSHYGKTPPCSKLIIDSGIPNVVVGVVDPFESVSGRGIKMLRDAGCSVEVGVLEQECREINRHFFTSVCKNRPFVMLKWAESQDGYIGLSDKCVSITGKATNVLSHRLRSRFDAIMVATNTILVDDSSLTVRSWYGNDPLRVILDRNGRIAQSAKVLSDGRPTLVFTEQKSNKKNNIEYINIAFDGDMLENILVELNRRGIRSLMVEGGAMLHQSFINRGLYDQIYRYVADDSFAKRGFDLSKAVAAPNLGTATPNHKEYIGSDTLYCY